MLLHVKTSYSYFGSKSSLLFQNHKEKQTDVSHCRSAEKWTEQLIKAVFFLSTSHLGIQRHFCSAARWVRAAGASWVWDRVRSHTQAPRAPSLYFLPRHHGKGTETLSTGNREEHKYSRVSTYRVQPLKLHFQKLLWSTTALTLLKVNEWDRILIAL